MTNKSIRKTYEVDFYDIANEKTRQREIKPYVLLNDEITKIVVVNKPINETRDENGFTIIGVVDFLLRYIK